MSSSMNTILPPGCVLIEIPSSQDKYPEKGPEQLIESVSPEALHQHVFTARSDAVLADGKGKYAFGNYGTYHEFPSLIPVYISCDIQAKTGANNGRRTVHVHPSKAKGAILKALVFVDPLLVDMVDGSWLKMLFRLSPAPARPQVLRKVIAVKNTERKHSADPGVLIYLKVAEGLNIDGSTV